MRRRYNVQMKLPSLALVVALAAIGGSAAAKPPPLPKTKTRATPGLIEALALNGSRVAYDVAGSYGARTRCNTVYVWNVRRNATTRVSGRPTCLADNSSTGAGVRELALAGGRVAWIVNQGGNSESRDSLYVSSPAGSRERLVASAFEDRRRQRDPHRQLARRSCRRGQLPRGRPLGDGFGRHRQVGAAQRVGARLDDLAGGTETMLAESTDGRAVAVLRQDGSLGVYSTRGALLRTILPQHGVTEVGASRGLPGDADHGRHARGLQLAFRQATPHLARRARSALARHQLQARVYAAPFPSGGYTRVVHVRRLLGGQDRVLATTPPQLEHVQLEPIGLAYAFNRIAANRPGAVVFVPMSRVVRAARG